MEKKEKSLRKAAIAAIVVLCVLVLAICAMNVLTLAEGLHRLTVMGDADVYAQTPSLWVSWLSGLVLPSGLVVMAVLAVLILRDIARSTSPFARRTTTRMKGISLVLALTGVALLVCQLIDVAVSPAMPDEIVELYGGGIGVFEGPQGPTAVFTPEVFTSSVIRDFEWMLILAVVIYCIALVFQYGSQLQQQADETL